MEIAMNERHFVSYLALAVATAVLWPALPSEAVELDPAAVTFVRPEQFKWRDPTDQAQTNQVTLHGDSTKPGLSVVINKFKPGRFGNPHYHPNDRFIMVIDGAPWRGTGTVFDPAHATRVPKGTFMIDHAGKVHWDGTKEESGAYLIVSNGPGGLTEVPKASGPWAGGDPSAATIILPEQIPWKDNGDNITANLAGDPSKPGLYAQLLTWKKGKSSRPHFHPNDRYIMVLAGTWWVGTGSRFDPASLAVPMQPGTFVTHFGKGVQWVGARDEETTIFVVGEGPTTATPVPEAN
jgi:quercetin dioxygenase-like cupin family protein